MSLMDTIKGAREEAASNGSPLDRSAREERAARREREATAKESGQQDSGSAANAGFERRSAARGKPTRKAAAGVRVVNASGKTKSRASRASLSKEEQKAERKREREIDDRRYSVREMILEENPEYKRCNKIWHIFLIVGFAFAAVALALYGTVGSQGSNPNGAMAVAAMICMFVGYIILGVGLVYNWRTIKPLRGEADQRVQSMSDKQMRTIIDRGSVKKNKR